jgi:polyisoprenoid-binding protein YceI
MDRRPGTHRKAALLVAFLYLADLGVSARQCHAETYTFDTKATEIRFTYRIGPLPGSGRFAEVKGLVEFNERRPEQSRVDAVINAASLTAEPLVENELKGESFFNVAVQPEIRFKSRAVKATASNSAEVMGELTMNGVTQPVTLQVIHYPKGASQLAAAGPYFSATTRIKRSVFNMTAYQLLVDDEVEIQIDAPVRKK